MPYLKLFARYLKPLKLKVALLAVLILANIGLQLTNPQIMRYFIDTAISNSNYQQLLPAALLFIILAVFIQVMGIASAYYSEDVGWTSTNQLRADLLEHCLHLDMTFHHNHTSGEMIERIDGDVANIAVFFSQFLIYIVGNMLLLVGVIVVLLLEEWQLGLALIVYSILTLIGLSYFRRVAIPPWEKAQQASAELYGFLEEQLTNTEDIRSNGAASFTMRHFFKSRKSYFDNWLKASRMNSYISAAWWGFYGLGQILALLFAYYLFQEGRITIGTAYLIIYYIELISRPLNEIVAQIRGIQKAMASINRVQSLFNTSSRLQEGTQRLSLEKPLGITFENVSFSYLPGEPVLQNISFQLEEGKVLGLLGRTGSGKSTLIRLLFRLYDPVNGRITLRTNGSQTEINHIKLNNLRQNVGMIPQTVQLFHGTIRDNLTFFDKSVPDEKLLTVIRELGLADWFDSLPMGLDTELEAQVTDLSAGEAQLLAFMRVFLKNPGLILLDEASSRLDPATEHYVESVIDKLLEGRTGIIIAHRLNTVKRADYIMIIEKGQIQEFGSYESLANNPHSHFSNLLKTGLEEYLK